MSQNKFMLRFIQRYKWLLVFAVLLILNVIRYWPVKHVSKTAATGFPPTIGSGGSQGPGPGGFQAMAAAMQARIDALPDDQRAAAEQRMQDDKVFFASIQNLPPDERMAKTMAHFMDNPPPPGMFPPPPPPGSGGGGGGGFGGGFQASGGVPPIPPPAARRIFEQGYISAMQGAAPQ
jgi:hypothetical protein